MKIKHGLPPKRTPVYEFQACYLGLAIRRLESAFLRQFRRGQEITYESFEVFRKMPEYSQFDNAALVSGFVCSDLGNDYPFEQVHSAPEEAVAKMNFDEVRRYIHSLQRATKWSSEFNIHLWSAVSSGVLGMVAERIEGDPSLYQEIVEAVD